MTRLVTVTWLPKQPKKLVANVQKQYVMFVYEDEDIQHSAMAHIQKEFRLTCHALSAPLQHAC